MHWIFDVIQHGAFLYLMWINDGWEFGILYPDDDDDYVVL